MYPEARIEYLKEYCRSRIYIKRDDLIPFSYGGNKVRIAAELMKELKVRGCDTLISYGSPGSNMNRAAAQAAAKENIRCRVIIKREPGSGTDFVTMNESIVRSSGALITECTADNVRETVEQVLRLSESLGEKPYYIYGDSTGSGNEDVLMRASIAEYDEIAGFEKEAGVRFDHIVLALGTGMTVSGLCAGAWQNGAKFAGAGDAETGKTCCVLTGVWQEGAGLVDTGRTDSGLAGTGQAVARSVGSESSGTGRADTGKSCASVVINGISVARTKERASEVISGNLLKAGCPYMPHITDDYLCGGYGRYNAGIEEVITSVMAEHGIALDPTYTGKAFYGMLEEIKRGRIAGNVLFIHTGGYPLYKDYAGR